MTGTSATAGSLARKPTRAAAAHPSYPSFCFSSLLMGAALAVHTDVANTRQREAVAATRLHGARWGTRHPQPRPPPPPPASLMAPRFRARAAATPARWATSRAAGGEEAGEPCRGRAAERGRRPPAPNCVPKPPSRSPAPALPPPSALHGPEHRPQLSGVVV